MKASNDEATHLSEIGEALPDVSALRPEHPIIVQFENPRAYWYAVHTYARHEKRVHKDLSLRTLESFLPLYEAIRKWKNGCTVRVELPLFPGYLFVKIDPRERYKVLSLPGAIAIVGSPSGPWPLPEAEIASLRAGMQTRKFEPYPYLAHGERARFKAGPLAELTGYLLREPARLRLVHSVDVIRQATATEVEIDDVELIGPSPPASTLNRPGPQQQPPESLG